MDTLRRLAGLAWAKAKHAWRWRERLPWDPWGPRLAVVVLALVCLFLIGTCDNDSPPTGTPTRPLPKVAMVPLPALQRIVESMANTQIGFIDRIRGLEARPPRRIIVTDTVAEPYPVTNVVTVIRDGRLATVVQEQTPTGWTQRIEQGRDVEGCDELRIVGGEVICDTPRLGKFYGVLGSEVLGKIPSLNASEVTGYDAWAGLEWRKHRDASLSLALLYGIDQSARLRVEWRPSIW